MNDSSITINPYMPKKINARAQNTAHTRLSHTVAFLISGFENSFIVLFCSRCRALFL